MRSMETRRKWPANERPKRSTRSPQAHVPTLHLFMDAPCAARANQMPQVRIAVLEPAETRKGAEMKTVHPRFTYIALSECGAFVKVGTSRDSFYYKLASLRKQSEILKRGRLNFRYIAVLPGDVEGELCCKFRPFAAAGMEWFHAAPAILDFARAAERLVLDNLHDHYWHDEIVPACEACQGRGHTLAPLHIKCSACDGTGKLKPKKAKESQ